MTGIFTNFKAFLLAVLTNFRVKSWKTRGIVFLFNHMFWWKTNLHFALKDKQLLWNSNYNKTTSRHTQDVLAKFQKAKTSSVIRRRPE